MKQFSFFAVFLVACLLVACQPELPTPSIVGSGEEDGFEYVDLGLSVKWASCNIGATLPAEYGKYFAWGEIIAKEKYDWTTYVHCDGAKDALLRYNNNKDYGYTDNLTVLALCDTFYTPAPSGFAYDTIYKQTMGSIDTTIIYTDSIDVILTIDSVYIDTLSSSEIDSIIYLYDTLYVPKDTLYDTIYVNTSEIDTILVDTLYAPVIDFIARDDAAHENLSEAWRMPTDAEWNELRTKCTWIWATQNGVKGYFVTSNVEGYTENSIFLPAGGHALDDKKEHEGAYGNYWSSSLDTSNPTYAFGLYFDFEKVRKSREERSYGFAIRPVIQK